MVDFFKLFLSKSWEFFSIPWPGFDFSIGAAFLAVLTSVGALTALMKMCGVSFLGGFRPTGVFNRGGNNSNIKVSENRKGDTK